jgi:hypothetical protein
MDGLKRKKLLCTCRSAKAGYFSSMYKRFGNLCYVFGALRAFWGHSNRDLRIKVCIALVLEGSLVAILLIFSSLSVPHLLNLLVHIIGKWWRMENHS